MFAPVPSQPDWVTIEETIFKLWKDQKVYEKAFDQNTNEPEYILIEKPYLAHRKPTLKAVLTWAFKDAITRYQTLCGWHVKRFFGWNTNSPILGIEAEKRLGKLSSAQIQAQNLSRFIENARRATFNYLYDWEKLIERCGFWMPWQEASVIHTQDYTETVWGALKALWERGILSRKATIVPYCPRCTTPLSQQEASSKCKSTHSKQIFLRLPLMEDSNTSLLIWTDEPWKLSANIAVTVHPEAEYVTLKCNDGEGGQEQLILSQFAYQRLFKDEKAFGISEAGAIEVINTFKGKKLKGSRYRPLFTFILSEKPAHYVVLDESTNSEHGSGIIPITSAHDESGLRAALENDLPIFTPLQLDGTFIPEARSWHTKFFKEVDALLIDELEVRGLLLWQETTLRNTPFCPFCNTPLLPFLQDVVLIDIISHQGKILQSSEKLSWYPDSYGETFKDRLISHQNWILSRSGHLGTPLPLWMDEDNDTIVMGSFEELAKLSHIAIEDIAWQVPAIDEITFLNPKTGKTMRRLPDILDAHFSCALLAAAQKQIDIFPPQQKELASSTKIAADIICEPDEEILDWVYAVHIVHTLLFDQPAAHNILCINPTLESEAQRTSQEENQLKEMWEALDKHGTDFVRWALYKQSAEKQPLLLSSEHIFTLSQPFFTSLWKIYSFFVTYSSSSGWKPPKHHTDNFSLTDESPLLDRWIFSTLQRMLREINEAMQGYRLHQAVSLIEQWVLDLAQVYLPQMHQRFWDVATKQEADLAYHRLYILLIIINRIIAPFTPFLAETMYQNLVRTFYENMPISVHFTSFPIIEANYEDETLNQEMAFIIHLAQIGHQAAEKTVMQEKAVFSEAVFTLKTTTEIILVEKYHPLLGNMLKVKLVTTHLKNEDLQLEKNEYSLIALSEDGYQVVLIAKKI